MAKSTLLFNQQGIKAVQLTEDTITVYYVDGNEPLHIHSDDVMYAYHRKQFDDLADANLATLEDPASTEEA